ncbi:MAG: epoxyqueuosine reductase [Oscillospiraceae bacterium]|nr:epoxyqueuosine reductase [Oscillospiraceae bacterium]
MQNIREYILSLGADLVGFADISQVPAENRHNLPYGIAIAITLNPDVVKLIEKGVSIEYFDEYTDVTQKLDDICEFTAKYILDLNKGYKAIAQTRHFVRAPSGTRHPKVLLPHKTVAALSGFGWIGKNSLLITPQFGSALRLTSVLTDAPVPEINKSEYSCLCGNCTVCVDICPGRAIKNVTWDINKDRDDLINYDACETAVKKRGEPINKQNGTCGLCMAMCPHTKKYLNENANTDM